MRLKAAIIGIFAAGLFSSAPAFAQTTKERLLQLETALSELRASQPAATDAALKIAALETEVQALTGRVEELSFQLRQANQRLDAVSAALSTDAGVGPALSSAAGGAPTPLQPGDPIADQIAASATDVELPLDTEAAYQYASDFLLDGDYARAQKAFELFVSAFPNSARTPDAYLRLGEIYMATGAIAPAADTFLNHIRKYPNDPRSVEAHLKLGTAFARLNKTDEACKVFRALKAKFASASPAILQRADLEMQRAGCR